MLKKLLAILTLAVCVALLLSDSAQSQRRSQQVREKQPEATVTQPKGTEEQRGTEQFPFVIKTLPSQTTDEERAQEAKERERIAEVDRKKADSDANIVKYTAEL